MLLYFLRHAIAVERGHPKYKDDSLRPLTTQGQKKMHGAALGMKALGLKFDTILSSPYVRARQTSETVAEVYNIKNKNIHISAHLLPPASSKKLIHELQVSFQKAKSVLLVGHEPHITDLISELLQSHQPLNIDFKKGSLCELTINLTSKDVSASLNWLLTSAQLNQLNPGL